MSAVESEFEFSDNQFEWVCQQVKERTGIHLTESKRNLVYNRLASRIRRLGIGSFNDYFKVVEESGSDEIEQFVNALTTNVTSFFRELHHFEFLTGTVIPQLRKKRRIRIWSAGCSTGMEPYSIAMVLRQNLSENELLDLKIIATDLDTTVLETAANGIYPDKVAESIGPERLRQFVFKGKGKQAGNVRMRPELQKLITFRHLNLMAEWPFSEPFDVIFCRNVVIYFDKETQKNLWRRYSQLLVPSGYLFVGHSESITGQADLQLVGRTIYQRQGA